ncbi:MAG: hypothetical protein FJZ95_08175 [Chloroflexi bacterium]|nr:hypothetical protein [Chloroflexota bacterium]
MKIWKKANRPERAESSAGKPRKGRRIPMAKAIRILVAATLALAVLISLLFWWGARNDDPGPPTTRTTETTRFIATNAAKLDYKVHLTPNILYETSVLDAGGIYFSKLIDYIDTTASYEFSADQSAQLSGKYSVTAILEGDNIPQKKFPIVLGTPEGSLSFDHSAKLDYVVHLKPNSLYTTTTLGPGEQYFANIVDHVAVSASYALQTSRLSQSTGVYEVVALVRAEGYWEKSQTLVPKTIFDASARSTAFSQPFDIDIEAFRQLAENVNDELGINTRKLELLIQFNINLHGKTEDTDAHDVLMSSMTIPLGTSVFTITGDLSEQKSGLFEPETAGAQQISFSSTGKGTTYTQNFRIDLTPYRETV